MAVFKGLKKILKTKKIMHMICLKESAEWKGQKLPRRNGRCFNFNFQLFAPNFVNNKYSASSIELPLIKKDNPAFHYLKKIMGWCVVKNGAKIPGAVLSLKLLFNSKIQHFYHWKSALLTYHVLNRQIQCPGRLTSRCTRQFSLHNFFGLASLKHKKIIPGKSRVNSVLILFKTELMK